MADIDQQPQQNLQGADARRKIVELGRSMRTCMFGSQTAQQGADFRPMGLQTVDDDGSLWFLSSSESEKNADIARDDRVVLTFQDDSAFRYLYLFGRARIHTDRATIERNWTALAHNWFDGKDDPRLTVISVHPEGGHYWETQSGKLVSMFKLALGAATGGAISDDGGVDGQLSL